MPELDLGQIESKEGEGSGRQTGQRKVQQPVTTVCKLEPEHWNNVPVIVYEAIAKIVAAVDDAEAKKHRKYDEITKQFRDVRSMVGATETTFKSENDKIYDQIEADKRLAKE